MKPEVTVNGITFYPVPQFSDIDVAYGADESAYFERHNRPDIPKDFTNMVSTWFFNGGDLPQFHPKVNPEEAHIAIRAWLRSMAPPHESKIDTVAYAVWLWTHPTALDEVENG